MPELPEVETTRAGIAPHIIDQAITEVMIRNRNLRWPVTSGLANKLIGHAFHSITRRGKYLLLSSDHGSLIIHLGMSGSLRIVPSGSDADKHDHVDILFAHGLCLRYHDPRRFGCILWTKDDPLQHKLLATLGPEPLTKDFSGQLLFDLSRNKKAAIKTFIMDSKVVVGVGNIYASEALFRAGIHPKRAAGKVSKPRYEQLAKDIVEVLSEAISQGGTTLRDFVGGDGKPGYFQQTLAVYGREGEACIRCGAAVKCVVLGQRSTYFCAHCQT